MEMTRQVPAVRIRNGDRVLQDETVVREETLCLYLNGNLLVRLLCSPTDLEDLAVGFLFSEGIVKGPGDVLSIEAGATDTTLFVSTGTEGPDSIAMSGAVRTSGCGGGVSLTNTAQGINPVSSDLRIRADEILSISRQFEEASDLFRQTGGVHACALASGASLSILREDIGRHNAVDKVLGAAVLGKADIDLSLSVAYVSGRISSEMVLKTARAGVGTIVSRTAPTSTAVSLAAELGICVIGFVRARRMNVYTHPDRVV
jgi:FdhD protein